MKPIKYLLVVVLLLVINSCKDKTTNPPDDNNNKPPGYQEDIDWPSLANSPWPMYHHDPQNTGRSKNSGPKIGNLKLKLENIYSQSGIVVGSDSVIYFTTSIFPNGSLYSANWDGTINWTFKIEGSFNTPTIANDGTIYVSNYCCLFAINPDGTQKWKFEPGAYQKAVYVGIDGIIYLTDGADLFAVDKSGVLKWKKKGYWGDKFIFSPDGKTLYIYGSITKGMISFDIINQNINWQFKNSEVNSAIVDSYGNIFLHIKEEEGYKIYSITRDKDIRWEFETNELTFEMTLDKDGNLYFGTSNLYSLDYEGNLRWKIQNNVGTDLVCDIEGNIYLIDFALQIISIANTGQLNWSFNTSDQATTGFSAAIAFNNLIVPTWESGFIYLIK